MKKRLMQQAAEAAAASQRAPLETLIEQFKDFQLHDKLWSLQTSDKEDDELSHLLRQRLEASAPKETAKAASSEPGRFKWETSLDRKFTFDFARAVPHSHIDRIAWTQGMKGVERSEAGAEGVFFVDTNDGAFVVKGSRSLASEAYASLLAARLGVYSPRWRIVTVGNPEGRLMMRVLSDLDPSGRVEFNLGSLAHVLIKSYLVGSTLSKVDATKASRILGSSQAGHDHLISLGRMLALDVLCNNGDRLPLIWDNRGNPGNIMFAFEGGEVVSVDGQVCPIDIETAPDQYDAYLDKIRLLLKDLKKAGANGEVAAFTRVREKLQEFTHFDIGTEGTLLLQQGFLEVAANTQKINITHIELRMWREMLDEYSPAIVGLNSASPDFVWAVWSVFQEVFPCG
eukprot:m.164318 g.164318  ORF g.164318 m.164318 type:complete len:399 (-) comp17131_c3_seq1:407-1603(-)